MALLRMLGFLVLMLGLAGCGDAVEPADTDPADVEKSEPETSETEEVVEEPQPITVPDVTGVPVSEAREALQAAGLEASVETTETTDETEAELVLAQSPRAGEATDSGDVELTVGEFIRQVEVPDVAGTARTDATSTLRDAGFEVDVETVEVEDEAQDGTVVDQTPQAGAQAPEGERVSITVAEYVPPPLTRSQENAVAKAREYLSFTSFSRTGLIEQLEYEGFSNADATFAVDHIEVDWNEQAALKAEEYLEFTSFSRSGLIEQLQYEGFTPEQARYGVDQTGL